MRPYRAIVGFLLTLFVGMGVTHLVAQGDECPTAIQQALLSAGQFCPNVGRNQVCYGNTLVSASNWEGAPLPDFGQPGNLVDAADVASLVTAPFDIATKNWGVAVMRLQANIPDTLPGQNVTFVVFGDVDLQNQVAPGQIVAPNELSGTTLSNPNLRAGPGTNWNVVGSLKEGDKLSVIGKDATGNWLQVVNQSQVRWVATRFVQLEGDAGTLDVIDPKNKNQLLYQAPMQAFVVKTRVNDTQCDSVPTGGMIVQSPEHLTVNFLANGIEMSVGSTALLRFDDAKGNLHVVTLAGNVGVKSTSTVQNVEPGYALDVRKGEAPVESARYEYDDVHDLPLSLLPESVNAPPPDGTEVSVSVCDVKNNGVLRQPISAELPIIFGEALGGVDANAAKAVRENSIVSVTLNGVAVQPWSISDPYQSTSSVNLNSGQQTGQATLQKWWFVLPHPKPGRYNAEMTWTYNGTKRFNCSITVR